MTATIPATSVNPGKTLGIVGFVLALLQFNVISLIISIVAFAKSKKAGHGNGFAVWGIVLSVLSIIGFLILILAGGALFAGVASQCAELGSGVWELDNGVTVTCP